MGWFFSFHRFNIFQLQVFQSWSSAWAIASTALLQFFFFFSKYETPNGTVTCSEASSTAYEFSRVCLVAPHWFPLCYSSRHTRCVTDWPSRRRDDSLIHALIVSFFFCLLLIQSFPSSQKSLRYTCKNSEGKQWCTHTHRVSPRWLHSEIGSMFLDASPKIPLTCGTNFSMRTSIF